MVTMFFAGLALGLANTATCLVTCAPVALIAVAESGGGSRWAAARALALFLAGRLGSYLALGALVGALAHRITLSDLQRPMGAAFAVLALALWLRGGLTGAPGSGLCLAVGGPPGSRRWPLVLGALSGLQICPPLLLAVGVALTAGGAAAGAAHFAGFFLGSSTGLLPLAAWPLFGDRLEQRRLETARAALTLVVGFVFFCFGLDQLFPAQRTLVLNVRETDLKEVMPKARVFTALDDPPRFEARRSPDERAPMGACFVTSRVAPAHTLGYGGPVGVLVGIDRQGTIVGIKLLPHRETPLYVERIEDAAYLGRYRGRRVVEPLILGRDVDAVTAATVTAEAVCAGVREAGRAVARASFGLSTASGPVAPWWSGFLQPKPVVLVLYVLLVPFALRRFRSARFRSAVLALSAVVMGVVLLQFFSIGHVVMIGARHWPSLPAGASWYALVGAVLLVTVLAGRVYCSAICPFGALTELAVRCNPHATSPSVTLSRRLRSLRFVLLVATPSAFFALGRRDVTMWEPFASTFSVLSGRSSPSDPCALLLLLLILGLCLTSRRFWCHHLCPAGAALEVVARLRPSRVGPRGAGGGFDG